MELIIFLLCTGIIWLIVRFLRGSGSKSPPSVAEPHCIVTSQTQLQHRLTVPPLSPAMVIFSANEEWLSNRWSKAMATKQHGAEGKKLPSWYFDPITERQIERLEADGYRLDLSRFSKGQASDLIGLLKPPDPDDEEILNFFKCPAHCLNETRGKQFAASLLSDPNSQSIWNARPAKPWQRQLLKSYGISIPKGLNFEAASTLITTTEKELAATNPELLQRTKTMNRLLDEISDSETRMTYGFKKPPLSVIKEAIRELEDEGQTLDDMSDNIYSVVERIQKLRPDL